VIRESPSSWAAIAVSILSNCPYRFSYSSSRVSFADAAAVLVDESFVDDEAADFCFFLLALFGINMGAEQIKIASEDCN